MVLLSTHAQGAIRLRSIPLVAIGGLLLLVVLAMVVSALSNIGLPTRSKDPERLSEAEKASLEELFRLRSALGNAVWPGWGDVDTGVIVHNESTVFLVGYPGDEPPPPGWVMMPRGEVRGGAWEPVPGETFLGAPIYRQPLPGPDKTPENFTVKVGDAWVATLATREYAEVSFVQGFRKDLPPFLRPIFPYRLMWSAMMGTTEAYVGGWRTRVSTPSRAPWCPSAWLRRRPWRSSRTATPGMPRATPGGLSPRRFTLQLKGAFQDGGRHAAPSAPDARSRPLRSISVRKVPGTAESPRH